MKPEELTKQELQDLLAKKEATEKQAQAKAEKELENKKEAFLKKACSSFIEQSEALTKIKTETIDEADVLYKKMFEIHGKTPKNQKTITIKNDTYKIVVENQERFEFTEEANVHIATVQEIFNKKFAGRNQGFYKLLESVLMKNTKGEFDPKLLTKARQQVKDLEDQELIQAFEKLTDCQRVCGTSTYCRAYQMNVKSKKWEDINVQFSSL